jgi:hypothetical protein
LAAVTEPFFAAPDFKEPIISIGLMAEELSFKFGGGFLAGGLPHPPGVFLTRGFLR